MGCSERDGIAPVCKLLVGHTSIATFSSRILRSNASSFAAATPCPILFAPKSSAALTLSAPAASPAPAANVQAPVNITVNPASAQPEAVGRSVYNLAERYLVKTLKGAAL